MSSREYVARRSKPESFKGPRTRTLAYRVTGHGRPTRVGVVGRQDLEKVAVKRRGRRAPANRTAFGGGVRHQISNIGSQDMNDEVWLKLANRVNTLAAMPDVAGIVITHGTDTIEETAYFLNLVVTSKKPVVMTAAMRPATALSADGPLNFYNAVAVAANKEAAGRGVPRRHQRLDSRRRLVDEDAHDRGQTFMSPLSGLIGTVAYGQVELARMPGARHTADTEFSLEGPSSTTLHR